MFYFGLNNKGDFVMSKQDTIMEKLEILRLSNTQANKITKECIESALILLMKEKRFEDISVTEIVKKAGVSRTAYYRNYESKEDILEHLLTNVIDTIYLSMKKKDIENNDFEYWPTLFENIKPFAESFKLLIKANFGEKIQDSIFQRIKNDYADMSVKEKYTEQFWSGAVYAVIKLWIMNNMEEPPQEMAMICSNIFDE